MNSSPPKHPGEILLKSFMERRKLTRHDLSGLMEMPYVRVLALLQGSTSITAIMAIRLAEAFGTRAEYWMELQNAYDLWKARERLEKDRKSVQVKITKELGY